MRVRWRASTSWGAFWSRGGSGWTWCGVYNGQTWSGDALLPSAANAYGLSISPAVAAFNGKLYVVREGRGDSGWILVCYRDATPASVSGIPEEPQALGTWGFLSGWDA